MSQRMGYERWYEPKKASAASLLLSYNVARIDCLPCAFDPGCLDSIDVRSIPTPSHLSVKSGHAWVRRLACCRQERRWSKAKTPSTRHQRQQRRLPRGQIFRALPKEGVLSCPTSGAG
jgi:hypothetical protein